jgi:putative transposase
MIRLQAFKYELMPNGGPTRDLRRFTGSRRFVFNMARALQRTTYEAGGKKLGFAGLCQQLTEWRHGIQTPWLKDAPVHPLQQSHKDLERAHGNFFAKRALFPRFKREGPSESLRDPHAKQFEIDAANGRFKLPEPGWVRDRNSPQQPGQSGDGEEHHGEPVRRQTTGRRRRRFRTSPPESATPGATSCTRPRRPSARATRWCVSRTCR